MMMEYANDEEQFVLLAVVQDPLKTLRPQLAENVAALNKANERLDEIKPDWRESTAQNGDNEIGEGAIYGPDAGYGISGEMIRNSTFNSATAAKLGSDKPEELIAFRDELVQQQVMVRSEIRSEEQTQAEEAEKAASRRHDYGAAIQTWLKVLFRKGQLRPLLEELDLDEQLYL
jgi:ubiquitin carboxyl-terminal hydrolase L5